MNISKLLVVNFKYIRIVRNYYSYQSAVISELPVSLTIIPFDIFVRIIIILYSLQLYRQRMRPKSRPNSPRLEPCHRRCSFRYAFLCTRSHENTRITAFRMRTICSVFSVACGIQNIVTLSRIFGTHPVDYLPNVLIMPNVQTNDWQIGMRCNILQLSSALSFGALLTLLISI